MSFSALTGALLAPMSLVRPPVIPAFAPYEKFSAHVQQLARGLLQASVGKGVPVALLASTRPEWMVACLAAIHACAVAVPLDFQLGDEGLTHVLNDSGSRFLLTTTDQVKRLHSLELKSRPRGILLDGATDDKQHWLQQRKLH
jgi:long-subunit acyl-CoA synthetase (AMP-forming)